MSRLPQLLLSRENTSGLPLAYLLPSATKPSTCGTWVPVACRMGFRAESAVRHAGTLQHIRYDDAAFSSTTRRTTSKFSAWRSRRPLQHARIGSGWRCRDACTDMRRSGAGKSPRARAAPWRLRARGRCSRPPHLSPSTAMAAKSSPTPPGSVRAPRCAGRWPSRADHRCIDTERGAGRHCPCRFMGHGERHADSVHGSDRNVAPNHGSYVKREDVTPVD